MEQKIADSQKVRKHCQQVNLDPKDLEIFFPNNVIASYFLSLFPCSQKYCSFTYSHVLLVVLFFYYKGYLVKLENTWDIWGSESTDVEKRRKKLIDCFCQVLQ